MQSNKARHSTQMHYNLNVICIIFAYMYHSNEERQFMIHHPPPNPPQWCIPVRWHPENSRILTFCFIILHWVTNRNRNQGYCLNLISTLYCSCSRNMSNQFKIIEQKTNKIVLFFPVNSKCLGPVKVFEMCKHVVRAIAFTHVVRAIAYHASFARP